METRELSAEGHTDSELDLGESHSSERDSTPSQLPFGLSARGLRGTAAVVGFVVIVSAAVIGGSLAVDSVARWDGDRPDGSALREEVQLDAPAPTSADDPADRDEKAGDGQDRTSGSGKDRDSGDRPASSGSGNDDDQDEAGDGGDADSGTSDRVTPKKKQTKTRQPVPLAAMGIVRNIATGQCIDLPDSGVPAVGSAVNQYTCIPGADDNQDFELVQQPDGLLLRNLRTNYCLDLPDTGSVQPGALVLVGPCQAGDTDNQMFRAEQQGDGYYLRHVKSGLCLDVEGAVAEERNRPGQLLTLYTCSPNDDHTWIVG